MEMIETFPIEPAAFRIHTGTGGVIHYTVERMSHPDYAARLHDLGVKSEINEGLQLLIRDGLTDAEFVSGFTVPGDDGDELTVTVEGTFRLCPDYKLLRRIVWWLCNCKDEERLTHGEFIAEFGVVRGRAAASRWDYDGGNLMSMVAFFDDDPDEGERFLNLVMRKVVQYERRLRKIKGSVEEGPSEGAAPVVSGRDVKRGRGCSGDADRAELPGKAGVVPRESKGQAPRGCGCRRKP